MMFRNRDYGFTFECAKQFGSHDLERGNVVPSSTSYIASTHTHHKILTDHTFDTSDKLSGVYLKRGPRSAQGFRGMNIPLARIMVRSVAEAYPTTGTCRFRNSLGASAIAAMNSNSGRISSHGPFKWTRRTDQATA